MTDRWDLAIDSSGNIAMAGEPYALAQDAASNIRTFAGECAYNTSLGIPYFQSILGKRPQLEFMRAKFKDAANQVPDVLSSQVFFSDFANRTVSGQVQVTGPKGVAAVNFNPVKLPNIGKLLDTNFILNASTLG